MHTRVRQEVEQELPELFAELCLWLTGAGSVQQAREMWAGVAALLPDRSSTQWLAGQLAFAAGRYSEAELRYRQALVLKPADPTARAYLAESLIAQRRFLEARKLLDELAQERTRERGDDPALRFASELRKGLEAGLFHRANLS